MGFLSYKYQSQLPEDSKEAGIYTYKEGLAYALSYDIGLWIGYIQISDGLAACWQKAHVLTYFDTPLHSTAFAVVNIFKTHRWKWQDQEVCPIGGSTFVPQYCFWYLNGVTVPYVEILKERKRTKLEKIARDCLKEENV